MSRRATTTPLAAAARGLAAGLAGTGVMTAYQVAVAKLRDSESSDVPAQVGKRLIEGVLQPPERIPASMSPSNRARPEAPASPGSTTPAPMATNVAMSVSTTKSGAGAGPWRTRTRPWRPRN